MKPPRSTPDVIASMSALQKYQHASDRLRSALVLARSAACALEEVPMMRRRMIGVLDELEAIEHFVASIAFTR